MGACGIKHNLRAADSTVGSPQVPVGFEEELVIKGGEFRRQRIRVDEKIFDHETGAGASAIGLPDRNRSRAGQDAGSGFAFEAGIDGIAEPPVDGTFLEAAGF